MANQINEIIQQLERQRSAIEKALNALREVSGSNVSSSTAPSVSQPGRKKRRGGMTPDGRRRLSEALRQRWAAKRAAQEAAGTPAKKKGRKAA